LREVNVALQVQNDIKTLSKVHIEAMKTFVARYEHEKQAWRDALVTQNTQRNSEIEEIQLALEQECKHLQQTCDAMGSASRKDSQDMAKGFDEEVRVLCRDLSQGVEREREARCRSDSSDITLRLAIVLVQELLRESADFHLELTMTVDLQRETQRSLAGVMLALQALVLSVTSINLAVSNLMENASIEFETHVLKENRQEEDRAIKGKEMEKLLAELDYSLHVGHRDQNNQQTHIVSLTDELSKLMTENEALQPAISALQHQLSEHANTREAMEDLKVSHLEIIASMHQQLAEQTNVSQEAMEHLKQSKQEEFHNLKDSQQQEIDDVKTWRKKEVENLEKSRQEQMAQVNLLHAVRVSDFHEQLTEQTETSRKELERVGNSHVEVISALQHQLSEHANT